MSFASEHPVLCLRAEDLGCGESFPGSKHGAIRASKAGWHFPRRGDNRGFCPAHLPEWVVEKRSAKLQRGSSG